MSRTSHRGDAIHRSVASILLAFLLAILSSAASAETTRNRISGATGGIVRFPQDLQPHNRGNLFGEAWIKLAFELDRSDRAVTSIYTLGNFVADSKGYSYNNTAKIGLGVSHSIQVNDALNLTFSARYDWQQERGNGRKTSGVRLAADYYFYKRWEAKPNETLAGLPQIASVFKSYGTLAIPGSLEKGDRNIVVTAGGEYSVDLDMPDTDWILSPFADFDLSWDLDQHDYNTKVVPGVGVKVRYPLDQGELFAGVRLSADFRPIGGTVETGPQLFLGWYKGF